MEEKNTPVTIVRPPRSIKNNFAYVVVGKSITNEIQEVHRINLKTKEKKVMFEHPEFKKLKNKLKII